MNRQWFGTLVFVAACSGGGIEPTANDAGADMGQDAQMQSDPDAGFDCANTDGSQSFDDVRGKVTVSPLYDAACEEVTGYAIESNASRRDGEPSSPRTVPELSGWPRLRSGSAVFDGLYALALEETRQNSVDAISDGAFNGGQPLPCPEGGCFETGALWHYVWTRDISYAVDLGLAALDPQRAKNSLLLKLSERREGGDRQVMQDTGTGGSYPVSTDRVVWAMGARAVLAQLDGAEATEFATQALDALLNTHAHDRAVVFDVATGLYRGEQSFLDWREQTYPSWVAGNPVHIGMSRTLSTNLLHLQSFKVAREFAAVLGRESDVAAYDGWIDGLSTAIAEHLWMPERGQYSSFLATGLDDSPSPQLDLLGSALAIEQGEAIDGARMVAGYPHMGQGVSVIFPQQQLTPIYHNRAEWPFVSAYWLRAASRVGNAAVASRMVESLLRGAGLNLSNMENWEAATGLPWVEDGDYSGPVVNSQRQLWSVAAFVSMVEQTLFGLRPELDGLRVEPQLPASVVEAWFADSSEVVLHDARYRAKPLTVRLQLPEEAGTGFLEVLSVSVDGQAVTGVVPAAQLNEGSVIEVVLGEGTSEEGAFTEVAVEDWRDVFAPRPPQFLLSRAGDDIRLDFATEDAEDVTWSVFRDGMRVAAGLSEPTWTDVGAAVGATRCWTVESCFVSSGNCSQHAEPVCYWGDFGERVVTYPAASLNNVGGNLSSDHGREHWGSWGDEGHQLTMNGVQPATSGRQLVQLMYGNGAGSTNTGITCAVKLVRVVDEGNDQQVGRGYVMMPHLGDWSLWGLSSFVEAEMQADRTYRVTIESDDARAINMSSFSHFSAYAGEGGEAKFNRTNVAELRVLSIGE